MKEEERTIEQSFEQLDEMIEQLESDELSLEESFRIYEKGMKLLKAVSERVDQVEKNIQQINEEGEVGTFE